MLPAHLSQPGIPDLRPAAEIGADLPPRARQVADERSRAQALIGPVEVD